MRTLGQIDGLHLSNHTAARTRLRFHYAGHEIWDAWLEPHGKMQVPDPRLVDIDVAANFLDPLTLVTYTVALRITSDPLAAPLGGVPVRLVAKTVVKSGAPSFLLEQEAVGKAGEISLLNLTAARVEFTFHFRQSPFVLAVFVPSQAAYRLDRGVIDVAATVNGYTTASLPIAPWATPIAVSMTADGYPTLTQLTHQGQS